MMMGRLYDPDCAAWSWVAADSSPWARVPTPAATAPRTDVFTKSRREKVMSSSWLVGKAEAYHAGKGFSPQRHQRHRENKRKSIKIDFFCGDLLRPVDFGSKKTFADAADRSSLGSVGLIRFGKTGYTPLPPGPWESSR